MITTGYKILDIIVILTFTRLIKNLFFKAVGNMKAAIYDRHAPAGIRIRRDCPKPTLKAGQVIVEVKACGLNPVDAKFCWGDKLP